MKKLVSMLLVLSLLVLPLFGAFAEAELEDTLIIYSTHTDKDIDIVVEGFNAVYPDIYVEVITGGTGELRARIEAEAANPQADVMMGGLSKADGSKYAALFDEYVSIHNDEMYDDCKNSNGVYSYFTTQITNFIINDALLSELGIEIKGYADLLQPELKGKIITADPTTSSSAWHFLTAMLQAMGGYDSEEAWSFVGKLIENIDGVVSSGSSGVYKSVIDGEYVVGLTFEDASVQQVIDGAQGVSIVYPAEGTTGIAYGCAMIKDCQHPEAAKAFLDYMLSAEGQAIRGEGMGCVRETNMNCEYVSPYMPATKDIVMLSEDFDYLDAHQDEMCNKWIDLWTAYNG